MRTDTHRPSVIEPVEYTFVGFECLPKGESVFDAPDMSFEHNRIRAHMGTTGGTYSRHQHGGNCHVCGAWAIYTALFHHKPTNTYIRTGLDCAEKLDSSVDGELFRAKAKNALDHRAGKRKAEAWLKDAGLEEAWRIYTADYESLPGKRYDRPWTDEDGVEHNDYVYEAHFEERTIRDIASKLVKYGSISEKQEAFVRKLIEQIPNRAKIEAERQAEIDAAEPVPVTDQRVEVEGEIVSIKAPGEYDRFDQTRMLIKTPKGYKLFGSLPDAIASLGTGSYNNPVDQGGLKGLRVKFMAKIQPSKRDPKFGFFKRPTKAVAM